MGLWLLVILWIGLAILVSKSTTKLAVGFKPRLLTLLAVILILGSFVFQDWVRFDFLQYFRLGLGDFLRELAPEAVDILGYATSSRIVGVVLGLATLKGWLLVFNPFFGVWTRAALLFPALLATAALIWLPFGATYSGSRLCKIVGVPMAGLSLLGLIGLAAAIPEVDALGVHNQINYAMLAVLLGVKLEMGPWLTLFGLALLFVGGVVEIGAGGATSDAVDSKEVAWPM